MLLIKYILPESEAHFMQTKELTPIIEIEDYTENTLSPNISTSTQNPAESTSTNHNFSTIIGEKGTHAATEMKKVLHDTAENVKFGFEQTKNSSQNFTQKTSEKITELGNNIADQTPTVIEKMKDFTHQTGKALSEGFFTFKNSFSKGTKKNVSSNTTNQAAAFNANSFETPKNTEETTSHYNTHTSVQQKQTPQPILQTNITLGTKPPTQIK